MFQSNTFKAVIAFLFLFIQIISAFELAPILTNNMVLQREQPIQIWGSGKPGETISIDFAGISKNCQVKADSTWIISFPAQKANTQAQSITISSMEKKICLNNILIGDLWVCSGQSNMEWPLQKEMHYENEKSQTEQALIRLNNPTPAGRYVYGVAYKDSLNSRLNAEKFYAWEEWQNCNFNTSKNMSAIAYYFAKSIVSKEGIPIGLINLSIGGAPIETFISRTAMENSSQFVSKVKPGNWLNNDNLPQWIRIRANQNIGTNLNGFGNDLGLNHAFKPGFAYESGIQSLLSLPIKGVIWYQGESNAQEIERVDEYPALMELLINDYRSKWKNPTMPFYWVQLSSIDTVAYQSRYWPEFRDGQRQLFAEVKYSGMAVCSDLGAKNDVHPRNKKDVGERLARWALRDVYNNKITVSGPLPRKVKYRNGKITISFEHAKNLKTADGLALRGFSIDGKTEIAASIKNNKITIDTKLKPEFVYYGWKPYTDANLVNIDDLPASTFKIPVR